MARDNWRIVVCLIALGGAYADVFDMINVSKAGMSVQQHKLQVIAENIANLSNVKTTGGEIYSQKRVVVKTDKQGNAPYVSRIEERPSVMERVYDPTNPDADKEGYMYLADRSLSTELVDMAMTRRLFEANAAIFNSAKQVAQTLMNLGK
ncbi:MAG: flagellar basal body rod C-terminal domain-containing protein [Candidatus Margulisiibacteriota bacterium]